MTTASASEAQNLRGYLAAVGRCIDGALDHSPFPSDQRTLLRATVERPRARSKADPLGDPLSLTYLIARAHGRRMDAQAVHVGAFCLLYILSLDLFDDVQDDDLAGTPHAEAGAAIAINSAISLCFLALDQLRRGLELERDHRRRMDYLTLLSHVSLRAAAGQHRDLMGSDGARTPTEVLDNQLAKTSSVSLLAECGGLLAGCDELACRRYRAVGQRMALFVQVRDDLRDIFGKERSPDLLSGKFTYPIACFYELADKQQIERLEALVRDLPATMQPLRDLLYDSGAVRQAAAALEQFREDIHLEIAATGNRAASLRTLLDVVDGLAESVYEPAPIEATARLWRPQGCWHQRVREQLQLLVERAGHYGLPGLPQLRPWHLPHWMYVPAKRTLFYPDIEGLPEEILPFQAMLLGEDDLDEVARVMEAQLPAVLAHEIFHVWRDACGRLTSDHWHEEWAANRLAVAYCACHEPATLASSLLLAECVVARLPHALDERAEQILSGCTTPNPDAKGYGMDMTAVAVVTLEMIRRLADEAPRWPDVVAELLTPTAPQLALSL